jgi:hypothetical protein
VRRRSPAGWTATRSGRVVGMTRVSAGRVPTWCCGRTPGADEVVGAAYACWPAMLTIQPTPNWSVHMPNSSPQTCFSSGMVTVPLPESFCQ